MARPFARTVLKVVAACVGVSVLLWGVATVCLYAAMLQPPETFGAIMARLPTKAMFVLPFKPLWMSARAGNVRIGDRAPDFALPVLHGDRVVTLSEACHQTPVVLIFGSYT